MIGFTDQVILAVLAVVAVGGFIDWRLGRCA